MEHISLPETQSYIISHYTYNLIYRHIKNEYKPSSPYVASVVKCLVNETTTTFSSSASQ